jgi:vacuolar-type H+-ATPase subunit H
MASREVLDKLLSVEKKAETIVSSAQEEADHRLAAVRESAESSFRAAHDAQIARLESVLAESRRTTDEEFASKIVEYRHSLEAAATDKGAFSRLCDTILSVDEA